MKMINKVVFRTVLFLLLVLGVAPAFAQAPENVEMADKFRADGKIYVVVAVLTIILAGVLLFLIMLDRKLGRLEKQLKA
jgi:K+-transporting ATPase A subunit